MVMENEINIKLLSMAGQGGSAFGFCLMELIKEYDNIMVLSADMSTPAGLDKFKATYSEHFMNVGIAEQNMIGIAAGLAEEGYKVICVAQACFITMRCFEQIRQFAGYMGIPMTLVGIGSGLSLQHMGNTHYALEDIALMHAIPGMRVMAPCDSLEAVKCLEAAVKNSGPTYIRMFGGTGIPVVHQQDFSFESGKGVLLRSGRDVAILSTGSMVVQAMRAAELLKEQGIECAVADIHTIKPFDDYLLRGMETKKMIVTVEEHRHTGGLGCVVAERLQDLKFKTRLLRLAVAADFPQPGSYQSMLEETGLSAPQIAKKIKEVYCAC